MDDIDIENIIFFFFCSGTSTDVNGINFHVSCVVLQEQIFILINVLLFFLIFPFKNLGICNFKLTIAITVI